MDQKVFDQSLASRWRSSPLAGSNAAYVAQMYEAYQRDAEALDKAWREYFDSLPPLAEEGSETAHDAVREQFRQLAMQPARKGVCRVPEDELHEARQVRVLQLINAYRFRGHQWASTNPLYPKSEAPIAELTLAHYQLEEHDLDTVFNTGSLMGPPRATLGEILDIIQATYCGSIGAEYMHITDTVEKRWIQQYLESGQGKRHFSARTRQRLLRQLMVAEQFEKYLHNRYVGQKRFSLEGGESLITILRELIWRGGEKHEVKEVAIGMAHRGRLNVLVNIMGKTPAELFREFEGTAENHVGTGDVKYHSGFSSNLSTGNDQVHVIIAFNPSHLEIVSPVVEGSVRARQDRRDDRYGCQVVPVVVHGDAAFAGQGVVMETFNMSQSRGYSTKGTVHVVINNQIGFTTSNQEDARSTLYCTDVAKMVNAPIFHVNGDDPEAVLLVTRMALDYRMRFSKDVVIDLVCYRRHGHSEADEPMATQPMMYQRIRQMPTTFERFCKKCLAEKVVTQAEVDEQIRRYHEKLDSGEIVADNFINSHKAAYAFEPAWHAFANQSCTIRIETGVEYQRLLDLSMQLQTLPDGFMLHPSVEKIRIARVKMARREIPMDWGAAETLAYATLMEDGFSVRLSGQDSARGTFFHRHAALHNQKDGEIYIPLRNLKNMDARFLVINSLLSEEAVLAFEYGYATTDPNTLTIWEAQFGDFANNAQGVIDQFISAGEQKWDRLCGLVLLLPHGLEGQGPEHSSARLERYLQLCAQQNMMVCVPTTAAQIFHLLRRQMLMTCRRPLIVMSPKSLLRHHVAQSPIDELTEGSFREVIGEVDPLPEERVERLIMCSGKVYYDLLAQRRKDKRDDVAIIRIEQLYPFPVEQAQKAIRRYHNAHSFVWCQEEPQNQGAWYSSQHHMRAVISNPANLEYAGRPFLAAPAVGYPSLHVKQQRELVLAALGERK